MCLTWNWALYMYDFVKYFNCEVGTVTIPILRKRKLKHREMKGFIQVTQPGNGRGTREPSTVTPELELRTPSLNIRPLRCGTSPVERFPGNLGKTVNGRLRVPPWRWSVTGWRTTSRETLETEFRMPCRVASSVSHRLWHSCPKFLSQMLLKTHKVNVLKSEDLKKI